MQISLLDRGNYYRGLLVLIRKDRFISAQERELMIQLGTSLDFDRKFCEAAIDDLLNNKHISDEPIVFATKGTAESFIRDAVMVASVDGAIHQKELDWLKTIAKANGIDEKLLHDKIHPGN